MDARKASFIREFLQQRPVEEWFAEEILRCLPAPHLLHPHLKKALLLRRLSSDISAGLLSDDTLQALELLEELDRSFGAATPPAALSSAYCAVAAELTVAPLRRVRGGAAAAAAAAEAGFFDAVDRIWNCRVADLEQSEARGMVGEGLTGWRTAVKKAVTTVAARELLLQRDTRWEAAEAVREYLRVALNEMGQPLLELVARAAGAEEDDAGYAKEDDTGGGEDADQSSGERLAPAGPSGVSSERSDPTGGPAEELAQMGHPASATGTEGSPHAPETAVFLLIILLLAMRMIAKMVKVYCSAETNETDEPARQTEEVITDWASERSTLPSSVDVNKVKEALKSSREELQKVVVDPLPDALERAADVQISMMEGSANPSDACENPNQTCANELGPSIQKDVQDTITERNADVDHSGIPCPGVPHHDVTDITARTYEGDVGSNECPSGKSANSSKRTRLSTRNRRVSPFMSQEVSKFVRRRKIKRWTPQEEDALREAIKKHGKGNWKFILKCYPRTFEDRTEIDLKDKWRNMTR